MIITIKSSGMAVSLSFTNKKMQISQIVQFQLNGTEWAQTDSEGTGATPTNFVS